MVVVHPPDTSSNQLSIINGANTLVFALPFPILKPHCYSMPSTVSHRKKTFRRRSDVNVDIWS